MTPPLKPLGDSSEQTSVTVARGNLYLSHVVYDLYLAGAGSAALLKHDEGVLIIPLIQQSAGGLLLKTKNLKGDRVIHAQEFLRQNGYREEFEEREYPVRWMSERAALLIVGILPEETSLL